MKRSIWTVALCAACVIAVLSLPVWAAGPNVSKNIVGEEDGVTTVVLRVAASSDNVYGVTIKDKSGSVADIYAPKGWVGISSGDHIIFRTDEKPIKAGSSMTFRILTTKKDASLSVSFRDSEGPLGQAQNI